MYNKGLYTVIETPTFRRTANGFWSDDVISEFVGFISRTPLAGDLVRGTKSLRKVRWAREGMGKSGGARVIYFVRTDAGEVVLVVAYAKGNVGILPTTFLNRLKELYDV